MQDEARKRAALLAANVENNSILKAHQNQAWQEQLEDKWYKNTKQNEFNEFRREQDMMKDEDRLWAEMLKETLLN